MYLFYRILPFLLLVTLTLGYPPRYARRRRQIHRAWLETPMRVDVIASETSSPLVVSTIANGRQIESVVKTIVVIVEVGGRKDGLKDG